MKLDHVEDPATWWSATRVRWARNVMKGRCTQSLNAYVHQRAELMAVYVPAKPLNAHKRRLLKKKDVTIEKSKQPGQDGVRGKTIEMSKQPGQDGVCGNFKDDTAQAIGATDGQATSSTDGQATSSADAWRAGQKCKWS